MLSTGDFMVKLIGKNLYQWDVGRLLEIKCSENINEVHFSQTGDTEALVVEPKDVDGVLVASIPNILLQQTTTLHVYLVVDNITISHNTFNITKREKPSDYVYTETEVKSYDELASRVKKLEEVDLTEEQLQKIEANITDKVKDNILNLRYDDLKEKPFYAEDANVYVLPEQTYTVEEPDGDAIVFLTPFELDEGKEYTVKWNGTEYKCICSVMQQEGVDGYFVGNTIIVGGEDTSEPFGIMSIPAMGMAMAVAIDGSTSVTMSVYYEGENIHKLDNKFLDLEWIPKGKLTLLAKEKTVSNTIGKGFPDLNKSMVYDGMELVVYYDGVRYELTVVDLGSEGFFTDNYMRYLQGDLTVPFALNFVSNRTNLMCVNENEHTASVYAVEYEKIPKKFLPDFVEGEQAEQIEKNTQDIGKLSERTEKNESDIAGKANVIVDSADGNNIVLTDSANEKPRGMKLFGKSEQTRYGGNQLIPYPFNETTKTVNGLTFTDEGNGWISVSGTSTEKTTFYLCLNTTLNVNNGDTVTASVEKTGSLNDLTIAGWTSTWGSFFETDSLALGTKHDKQTGNISSNLIRLQIYTNEIGLTYNGKVRVMINKGTTALPWEPYTDGIPSPNPQYPQDIHSVGDGGSVEVVVYKKNIHPNSLGDYDRINEDGKIVSHGLGNHASNMDNFPIPIGKTFTLSHNHVFSNGTCVVKLMQYDKNGTFIGRHGASAKSSKITFTPYKECEYMAVVIYDSEGVELDGLNIQLEVGTEATAYEPYNKQTLTLNTPNGLRGIKVSDLSIANYTDADGNMWCCDEIDLERGKYIQRFVKVTMDNNSRISDMAEWGINKTNVTNFRFNPQIDLKQYGTGVSTHFKFDDGVWKNDITGCYSLERGVIDFTMPFSVLGITNNSSYTERVEALRTWLVNNPVEFCFQLETPIETDLADITIPTMNYPTTTLLSDAHLKVNYVADTKGYIDKKFAELAKAMV